MYELIQLNEKDFYVDCPSRMGIVKISENEVVMIDSGNDKDAGKKALRHIEANGWNLKAVYNTHSHADHIGGNYYLQSHTGCMIYANETECDVANHTIWESALLFGGIPPKEFENKSFHAHESKVLELTAEMMPKGFGIIPLPGHSKDQVGYMTPNGTAFLGDAILERDILEKYPVSYVYDIETYLKTLEFLKDLQADNYVPAHATARTDIRELADFNIEVVNTVSGVIEEICRTPQTFEQIMKQIFDRYGITMSIQQFCLIGTTVRSHLVRLRCLGQMEMRYEDNRILWKAL